VVVVGATGQIGRPLCRELALTGHAVSVFSRDPPRARQLVPEAADYLEWNPGSRLTAQCAGHLAAADGVVYLAGGTLFDGRRHSRADIKAESRARASALGHLVAALGGLDRRPEIPAPLPGRARSSRRPRGRDRTRGTAIRGGVSIMRQPTPPDRAACSLLPQPLTDG
jgi:uncharacterized protein YbjT (DUF2867 family)